jgi:hypothetical protein
MGLDAGLSNRQVGERMVADEVEWLGQKGRELLADYDAQAPAHTFTTFDEVERIWHAVVAPRLPSFRTMQPKWDGQPDLPPDSPWGANQPLTGRWR